MKLKRARKVLRFQEKPGSNDAGGRRFDRLVAFDERSRKFPVRAVVPKKARSYTWHVPVRLDQGAEGACVGFGWAHELAARPVMVANVTNDFARNRIYLEAQRIDEWDGENYEGTSVLAGAKIVKTIGAMKEYRWAFGLDDLRLGVGHAGPAVIGVNWYSGMIDTDSMGFVKATGELYGGHCVCINGVSNKEKFFWGVNSWGSAWGLEGRFRITFDDMDKLLNEAGDACFPIGRTRVNV